MKKEPKALFGLILLVLFLGSFQRAETPSSEFGQTSFRESVRALIQVVPEVPCGLESEVFPGDIDSGHVDLDILRFLFASELCQSSIVSDDVMLRVVTKASMGDAAATLALMPLVIRFAQNTNSAEADSEVAQAVKFLSAPPLSENAIALHYKYLLLKASDKAQFRRDGESILREAAIRGDAFSAYLLLLDYSSGIQNRRSLGPLLECIADAGIPAAMHWFGHQLISGDMVLHSKSKAAYYWESAALLGDEKAIGSILHYYSRMATESPEVAEKRAVWGLVKDQLSNDPAIESQHLSAFSESEKLRLIALSEEISASIRTKRTMTLRRAYEVAIVGEEANCSDEIREIFENPTKKP